MNSCHDARTHGHDSARTVFRLAGHLAGMAFGWQVTALQPGASTAYVEAAHAAQQLAHNTLKLNTGSRA